MEGLNFKHDFVLIYLNERENAYDSYELMLLLSINYDFLQSLFEDLLHYKLIEKNKEILRYQITPLGMERLREQSLATFDMEGFLEINNEIARKEKKYSYENIFYIPKKFEK